MHREGQKALQEISEFKPDIVFANDDAAVAEVMMPLVGRNDISVVFSGMNGQPEMYNERKHYMETWAHPGSNVTGVYEKLYAAQAVKVMEQAVPGLRGKKVVMITDHTPTGNGLTKQFELELKDVTDVHWEVQRVSNWTEYMALIERLNDDPEVKAIYPVALSLPVDGGGRYAAAQIYDWTLAHSRKPEMAINYFFARMGLFGGAVENFSAMGRSGRPESGENSQWHEGRRSADRRRPRVRHCVQRQTRQGPWHRDSGTGACGGQCGL